MKQIFTIIILIIFSQIVSAQTKFIEYRTFNSDRESGYIDGLLIHLNENPEDKALVVVYAERNWKRIGNVLGQVEGTKKYISLREGRKKPSNLDRISFVVTEGKENFSKEIWIAKKEEIFPAFKPLDLDLSNIKNKYLYAQRSFNYEPPVPILDSGNVDLRSFAEILKQNKTFKGLILIDKYYLIYAVNFRRDLIKDFGIDVNKVSIRFRNNKSGEVDFYIVPAIIKSKRR